jgi:hypothetical protein
MNAFLTDLFCRSAAASFDKQLHISRLVGQEDWYFNMTSGLLSFGLHLHFQAQIIGTESDKDRTWLWAWANKDSNVPRELLRAADILRIHGRLQTIPAFTEPELPLGEVDSHAFAMIASGLCRADAYYRAPYDGGVLLLLIQDDAFPRCTEPPLLRIISVFPQAIASLSIPNHRLALIGYLDHYGLTHEDEGSQVIVKEKQEPMLTATFDEQNRLTQLVASVKPQAVGMSEKWDEGQLRRMLGG